MSPEDLKDGLRVYINKIDVTHRRHDSNSTMRDMIGGIYHITEVRKTLKAEHNVCAYIRASGRRGYTWAPEDLSIPNFKIIKGGKFDPENLII